jgi:hypothetical protein
MIEPVNTLYAKTTLYHIPDENAHDTVVVVDKPLSLFAPEIKQQLESILASIKLSINTVGLLEQQDSAQKLTDAVAQHAAKHVISFGKVSGTSFALHAISPFGNAEIIETVTVEELFKAPAHKKELWFSLKKMYGI